MEKLKEHEILSALNPLPPGFTLRILEETTSTNEVAKQLAQEGKAENTVVFAEKQTAGKGRLDRTWESPAYKNLYFSMVFRPMTRLGFLISTWGSLEAFSKSASLEMAIPGVMRPPRYSPFSLM